MRRAHLIINAVCCVLLLSGCASNQNGARPSSRNMQEVHHPNGLLVGVPEHFTARQTDDGFVIEPDADANARARYTVAVYVTLFKDKGVPAGAAQQTKALDGKQLRYHVDKREGGSGGAEYALAAYEVVPGGYIEYAQAVQSEHGEPDFALAWSIAAATKYEPSGQH